MRLVRRSTRAVNALAEVVASAPADPKTRDQWLERLWQAYQADAIPYIEALGEYWGALCGSPEVSARWADRLVGTCRLALDPDPNVHGYFHGTTVCLSAWPRDLTRKSWTYSRSIRVRSGPTASTV